MKKFAWLSIVLIVALHIRIHAQDAESLPENPIITPENANQIVELTMIGDGGVWDVETGELIYALQGYDMARVNTIAYSPNGNTIASVSGSTIFLWDTTIKSLLKQFEATESIASLIFSPDGNMLVSGGDLGVRVFDVAMGEAVQSMDISACCLAFSPDSQTLVIGSYDIVHLFDTNKWISWQIFLNEVQRGNITSVAVSPDGQSLLIIAVEVGGAENNYIWDLATLGFKYILKGYVDSIHIAIYSPDGLRVAGGATDGKLHVWDIETGEIVYDLQGVEIAIQTIAYSPDGRMIIAGHDDGTIEIWDVEAQTMVSVLNGHTDGLTTVAFSPDGRFIASSADDGTIRIWGVPNNE